MEARLLPNAPTHRQETACEEMFVPRHQNAGYKGLYSLDIDEYELVIPTKVTEDGQFLSHDLNHHHRNGEQELYFKTPGHGRRNKRSTEAVVNYHIPVGILGHKQPLHLELWPSSDFFAPGLVVERRTANLSAPRLSPPSVRATRCHYQGAIRGQPGSQVAVSACNGLAGLLRTEYGELWLEPVRGHGGGPGLQRPHIVFKRSAHNGAKKRKRKRRKRHEKNCGTREPRRLMETRLEWKQQVGKVKVQGRGKSRKTRWRRSVSKERHVEALLVADTSMMKFHEDGDVETYVLTIMNMVSALYRDASIGNNINVVVVRIILLEDDAAQKDLNITVNADETLDSFCKWQMGLNHPEDSHPNHHDVAILVTREDICARQNTPCSTLGVAHVGGMCQPDRSCNVNEDNGITLAHTITHEMGHNFGMYHDTEKIGCSRRQGNTLHVMTPSFEADAIEVAWSSCSRRDITNFLDQGSGQCLEDEPTQNDYNYPDLPPGAMYNAEHQCRLQFGTHTTAVCTPLEEICSRLWCVVEGACTTMLRPAAAGTHCGKHMWCLNQQCVTIGERPEAIHGGWSDWGSWSECSRTCGAGVSITERQCDHPVPAFGGKFCVGERRRYRVCNTEPCPDGVPSFRAVQCSNYNGQEFHGRNYTWLPYFDKTEPCELYCTDTDDTVIVPWGDSVIDGTPCNVGTRDMCISGICKRVGCDWEVDSVAREDRCGVCHGDGSQCKTQKGVYTKREGTGYKEIVVIPAGSRNIKVEEVGNSRNYIGIGSATSGRFFLNGKRQITLAGEYQVAGTPALYERERDWEKVRIPGPIKEDILIYLIYRGRYRNFGLKYEYTVPRKKPLRVPEYNWIFSDWSPCSATCGGGSQASHPVCQEKEEGAVRDELCNNTIKPDQLVRVCNTHQCPARWWIGPWQLCPVTCGEYAMRKRTVMCVVLHSEGSDGREMALPDRDCEGQERPGEHEPCPNLPPCATSSTSSPSPDYAATSGFISTSTAPLSEDDFIIDHGDTDEEEFGILNSNSSSVTSDTDDSLQDEEILLNSITTDRTYENIVQFVHSGENSSANTVHDSGRRDERVNVGGWAVTPWSPCSVTCGSGVRTRSVVCTKQHGICSLNIKPIVSEYCHTRQHCSYQQGLGWRSEVPTDCEDKLLSSLCSSFRHMCPTSWYIRMKCCNTCR
ncbi:A disintegrin and metalloproteinase with thrombospondin motifs 7-like isoform X2 [Zootermopsis nevadensis]|uniref:A disintegrin and metalloproteinase with thrombospondin motifs 7-like isoform X2 n=1 Tax=Zootermopsis nevadensis TaxID=136037 RepID=UPI000B8E6D7C|nr:A disintegrin and metalloproteinase with thrombospondin motifs 7-like isoform X2 [Zootermopsis nevadensis]XP_021933913.1 A disintegrin and metalloproteinase with thrombospondin motifs 7-like isoform X2 [Zootermopsis nevadensis]XP_021933948.1 A disintegrin and metalloproteinase with thrombospondin motifs 7-like isoform X2 [Zootermopsis nevadensis]